MNRRLVVLAPPSPAPQQLIFASRLVAVLAALAILVLMLAPRGMLTILVLLAMASAQQLFLMSAIPTFLTLAILTLATLMLAMAPQQ